MEAMRFFVETVERNCHDPNETAAMMRHRLRSISYQAELLNDPELLYAFRTHENARGVMMFEVQTLSRLDTILKRDPLWPYCHVHTTPVLGTVEMSREIEEFLGERILSDTDYGNLHWEPRAIQPDAEYWLAWKEVPPFSPLMSEEDQNSVYRRTVVSQRAHQSTKEFNDENPIGRSVGILVYEGPKSELLEHVTHCDVFRDSVVTYTPLTTLTVAWHQTVEQLTQRGWPVTETLPQALHARTDGVQAELVD